MPRRDVPGVGLRPLEMGNTRMFSPGRWRRCRVPQLRPLATQVPTAESHGRRSLARPLLVAAGAAEHGVVTLLGVVSTRTVCRGLRVPSGRSTRSPRSIQSWTAATRRRAPVRSTRRSRNSMTSGKLWPVSTWSSSKGTAAGANARRASSKTTTESLPPENSSPTLSNWPATSRRMWMDSFSRSLRWGESRVESAVVMSGVRILSWRCRPSDRPGDPHRRDGEGAGGAPDDGNPAG